MSTLLRATLVDWMHGGKGYVSKFHAIWGRPRLLVVCDSGLKLKPPVMFFYGLYNREVHQRSTTERIAIENFNQNKCQKKPGPIDP